MKYAKAIAALLGGLTPAALVGLLTVFHVHVDPAIIAEVYTVGAPILAGLFTAGGPANKVADVAVAKAAPVVAKVEAAAPAVEKVAATVETVAHELVPTPDALHN
jgi:hypothetical protein